MDTLAIVHFGEDENSLMEELKIQEEQLDKLLTLMMKSFNGIELWPIWLGLLLEKIAEMNLFKIMKKRMHIKN